MGNTFKIWIVLLLLLVVLIASLLLQRSSESAVRVNPQEEATSEQTENENTDESNVREDAIFEDTKEKSLMGEDPTIVAITKKPEDRGPFAPSEALNVQETFKVDPPMQSLGEDWKEGRGTSNFSMPVSEGRELEIQVERFESIGEEGGEFTGTVVGAPGSTVNLSYRGSAEAGRIDIPSEGRSYQILPGKDGAIIVQDRNPSLEAQAGAVFPPVGVELPPVPNFIPPPPPSGIFDAIPAAVPLP